MDSSDPSKAMSNLTLSNDEENSKEDSAIVPSTKRTQFLATYRQQRFPFRASVMLYIAENPTSPKLYQKMIKTCKFFLIQNPIIVLRVLNYDGIEWHTMGKLRWKLFIDVRKIMAKFWMTGTLFIGPRKYEDQNIISSIIPKFFRFDAKELHIKNQVIPLSDYVYLTSTAETVSLRNVTVKDENGSVLPVEKLVEVAKNAEKFYYTSDTTLSNITSKTFDELLKLPNFHELEYLFLSPISETFDIEAFYTYMKQNKRTLFDLVFDDAISEVYKIRLEEIIDEILATKNRDYFPPLIQFLGLDNRKKVQLIRLYRISRNALMEGEQ